MGGLQDADNTSRHFVSLVADGSAVPVGVAASPSNVFFHPRLEFSRRLGGVSVRRPSRESRSVSALKRSASISGHPWRVFSRAMGNQA